MSDSGEKEVGGEESERRSSSSSTSSSSGSVVSEDSLPIDRKSVLKVTSSRRQDLSL